MATEEARAAKVRIRVMGEHPSDFRWRDVLKQVDEALREVA
jgi:hypothetical protein